MLFDRRRFVSVIVALALALPITACDATDATPTYRYRLSVEVDTPEGLRSGSSVIEVRTSVASELSIPTPGAVYHRVRGEAVAVDLGEGRALFALLRSTTNTGWAANVMFRLAPRSAANGRDGFLDRYQAMLDMRNPIELPRYFPDEGHLSDVPARPMLVTFGDLDDPTSVERVDPDDLAASFGDGVSLRSIAVHMTDDPVTSGIEERLGWLSEFPEPSLKPDHALDDYSLAATLKHRAFRQGEY